MAATNDLERKLAVLRNWRDDVNKTAAKDPTAPFVPKNMPDRLLGIPSGSPKLDIILGGGIPVGKMTEIYGVFSAGKSTLSYQIIAELHKRNPNAVAVLLDAEGGFDPARGLRMGIDLGDPKIPDSGRLMRLIPRGPAEPTLDYIVQLAQMPPVDDKPVVDLIVIDSIASLVPKAEFEAEMEDQGMALLARLMSKFLRQLYLAMQTSGTTVILINQIRYKIGGYGNPMVVPGGNALDHYPHLHLSISAPASEAVKDKDGIIIAPIVHARIKKNRVNGGFGEAIMQITARDGVFFPYEAVKTGIAEGVVTKAGAYYSVETAGGEIKEQGEAAFIKAISKLSESVRIELYDRIVKAGIERREAGFVEGDIESVAEQPAGEVVPETAADAADETASLLAAPEKEEEIQA